MDNRMSSLKTTVTLSQPTQARNIQPSEDQPRKERLDLESQ
jgi:hypothetical protein